jgi:hypothetical protein
VDLDDALELVDAVADRSARLWALTTLAARRHLSGSETLSLLAAADHAPALERRLMVRLGRRRASRAAR